MAAAASPESRTLGDLMVSDVVGGVGDLAGRTLQRLTGMSLSGDDGATSLMQRASQSLTHNVLSAFS
jgi:hypothetical protein